MKFITIIILLLYTNLYSKNCIIWKNIQNNSINLNKDLDKIKEKIKENCIINNLTLFSKKEMCFNLEKKENTIKLIYFDIEKYKRNIKDIKFDLKKIEVVCNDKNKKIAKIKSQEMKEFEKEELNSLSKKYINCERNYRIIKKNICE